MIGEYEKASGFEEKNNYESQIPDKMMLKSNVLRNRIRDRMIQIGFLNPKDQVNLYDCGILNASNEIVKSMLRKILEEFFNQ